MKRAHRRFHFLIWMLLVPATVFVGLVAWKARVDVPTSQLPSGIIETDGGH